MRCRSPDNIWGFNYGCVGDVKRKFVPGWNSSSGVESKHNIISPAGFLCNRPSDCPRHLSAFNSCSCFLFKDVSWRHRQITARGWTTYCRNLHVIDGLICSFCALINHLHWHDREKLISARDVLQKQEKQLQCLLQWKGIPKPELTSEKKTQNKL